MRQQVKHHIIILTAWLCLLPLLTYGYTESAKTDNNGVNQRRLTYYYLAAQKQKALGNYNAMLTLLLHCLNIDPNNASANYDLAMLYLGIDRDSTGVNMLKKAVSEDPKNPWFLESLATTYLTLHKPEKAIPLLEEMGRLQTKRTDVQAELFKQYKSSGQTKEAIKALDRIQTLQGNSSSIAGAKYALYLDLKDTVQAFNQLKALCKEFPYDAASLLMLGDQYMAVDKTDSANIIYQKVEEIDPKNTNLQVSRLQYLLAIGDTLTYRHRCDSISLDEKADNNLRYKALGQIALEGASDTSLRQHADSIFTKALSPAKPPLPFLQIYLAYKAQTEGASDSIIVPILERILDVEPSDMNTLQQMLSYYANKNDFIKVGDLCQKALIYHPDELAFHYFLAVSLAQQEKKQEAVKALTTALRQADENSRPSLLGDIYALLGDIEHELGHEKEAFAAYDSCLVYAPDNATCLNNYAYFLSLKNDQLAKAEEMSYRSIKAQPNNKTFLDTYAWILFTQKDVTTARIYIDRVIDPSAADSTLLADEEARAVVLEHAGDIYAESGNIDEAVHYWQLSLQKDPTNALVKKKIKKRKYIRK